MTPLAFCAMILNELASKSANEPWVRGAHTLCQMYGPTDAKRFELIVGGLARRSDTSALTEGARWLLARWHAAQQQASTNGSPPDRLRASHPTRPEPGRS